MVVHKTIKVQTRKYNEFVLITSLCEDAVAESGVKEGMAYVIAMHTTIGIAVNESLECLESDLSVLMSRLGGRGIFPRPHAAYLRRYRRQSDRTSQIAPYRI